MKRALVALLLLARPLLGGYAGRDLVLPVVGRATSGGGREFLTTVWITNVGKRPAKATVSFLETAHKNLSPLQSQIEIAPGATRVYDPLDASVMGTNAATGALRIESNVDLVVSARISADDIATSFAGIPTRFAIGNGQSAVMHGYSAGSRYKLYVVETTGEPLAYFVTVSDPAGGVRAEKRLFIDRFEQRSLDLAELFSVTEGRTIRITGTNGNGRIVALGLQFTPGNADANAFEMSFPGASRFALSWTEALTYAGVALAVIVAALMRR